MNNKKATVIGGQGFIGQRIALYLSNLGFECWNPDRNYPWYHHNNNLHLGHVFYCAGLTADYLKRPADTVEAHVSLLCQILRSNNFNSLVYLSSTRLYDERSVLDNCIEEGGFMLSPDNPRHLYDLTKLTGESLCYALGHGKARIARLSNVYGKNDNPDGFLDNLLYKIQHSAIGDIITVDSSPYVSRDYIHIDDVVHSITSIGLHGTQKCYNVASGNNLSNEYLAEIVEKHSGRILKFTKNNVTPSPKIDITRLYEDVGVIPVSVDQRLKEWLSNLTKKSEQAS
jgi:nucleoside-diphosphate-sugar epimerase